MFDIGIAFGGGGTRGFAHLGILQALKEKGIEPDIISGVSAGSIVGSLVAYGKTPEEILEVFKTRSLFKYTSVQFPKNGLFNLKGLEHVIQKEIPVERIEELEKPLYIALSNLNTGEVDYFNKGPLSKMVLASSSIPILFSTIEINGYQYVDGGLLNNLPIEPLEGKCRKIIGVSISPIQPLNKISNLKQLASRVFHLSIEMNSIHRKRACDILLEPQELHSYDVLDTKKADEIFEIGYEYTKKLEINI